MTYSDNFQWKLVIVVWVEPLSLHKYFSVHRISEFKKGALNSNPTEVDGHWVVACLYSTPGDALDNWVFDFPSNQGKLDYSEYEVKCNSNTGKWEPEGLPDCVKPGIVR